MATKTSDPKTADGVTFEQALERYKMQRPGGLEKSTVESYQYGIQRFGQWMKINGHSFRDLDSFTISGFWPWLRDEFEFTENTLESYTKHVRSFLEFLGELGVVPSELYKTVEQYTATKSERDWDVDVPLERISRLVHHFRENYGPRKDALIFRVLATTGMRRSGIVALDVGDVRYRDETGPEIYLQNREKTKLKGRDKHERVIAIREQLFEDLNTYVESHREPCEQGDRNPLFTTRNGRIATETIRDIIYQLSTPSFTGIGSGECEGRPNRNQAPKCPESFSPHVLRKYHVTELRNKGVSFPDIGERVGAEPDALKTHYDKSTEEDKAERRYETMKEHL